MSKARHRTLVRHIPPRCLHGPVSPTALVESLNGVLPCGVDHPGWNRLGGNPGAQSRVPYSWILRPLFTNFNIRWGLTVIADSVEGPTTCTNMGPLWTVGVYEETINCLREISSSLEPLHTPSAAIAPICRCVSEIFGRRPPFIIATVTFSIGCARGAECLWM